MTNYRTVSPRYHVTYKHRRYWFEVRIIPHDMEHFDIVVEHYPAPGWFEQETFRADREAVMYRADARTAVLNFVKSSRKS